jgi:transaldolase
MQELAEAGVSAWIDSLSREMLHSGALARLIEEDSIVGVTSNPTIFQKALAEGDLYDAQLREVAAETDDPVEIFFALGMTDIREACDLMLPIWERTSGVDGWVSLEVDPTLAYEREKTFDQAIRFNKEVGRPNLYVKIPATEPGLGAIEDCIAKGVSINVTLIFSLERYAAVAEAYLRGLERLVAGGGDPASVLSVASFFVSRVDTLVDKELEGLIGKASADAEKARLTSLLGTSAIANAKLAYQKFKDIFHGPRFAALLAKGAQVQRCLWASTGTKNPKYSDCLYVDNLIGAETVNTVPPATYDAIKAHAKVALTLEADLDVSKKVFSDLAAVGIDMAAVTQKLQEDGLKSFVGSFDSIVSSIEAKRGALVGTAGS